MERVRQILQKFRFDNMTLQEASKLNEEEKLAFIINRIDNAIDVYEDDMKNEYIYSIR